VRAEDIVPVQVRTLPRAWELLGPGLYVSPL